MTVRLICNNINYFNRGIVSAYDGSGPAQQRTSATVSFAAEESGGPINDLSLTFHDVVEPVEYFPGKVYELTLSEAAVEE